MACLLERLGNTGGVSGNERKIRDIIIKEITPYVNEIKIDTMGNIIARKYGKNGKKTALIAHMDEPGFIVSGITDTGYIKFSPVGKIDPRTIVSKRVLIGEHEIKGVIGMKAIHLQKKTERENVVAVSDLFIDIGAKNKKEAEKLVGLGDYIAFDTEFKEIGETVKGKGLGAAISCACLIEALKNSGDSDIYAVFAVQSEIEGRGAHVAAYGIQPDEAVIIGAVEAADMFGAKTQEKTVKLGGGAVIAYADKNTRFDRNTTDKLIRLAAENGVKTQIGSFPENLSDGGAVQTACAGAVTVNIFVPCRYLHTPVNMASKADIEAAATLIGLFMRNGETK